MELTVFAGTFNPIHTAHLIMAETVRTCLNCEQILFIPSYIPPHKDNHLADAHHRLNMTKLAVEDNPYFKVSDIEFRIKSLSYTINTIKKLYEENPDIKGKIKFIIGADAYLGVKNWHNGNELIKLLDFIVLARPDSPQVNNTVINAPAIDISSSYIRKRVEKGQSIRYLVNDKVMDYIYEHKLYTGMD